MNLIDVLIREKVWVSTCNRTALGRHSPTTVWKDMCATCPRPVSHTSLSPGPDGTEYKQCHSVDIKGL